MIDGKPMMDEEIELREEMYEDVPTLDSLTIPELRMRLGILNKVIKEAQRDKDGRWTVAAAQQRRVNVALVTKIKAKRRELGVAEPRPVVVAVEAARAVAKGLSPWDE